MGGSMWPDCEDVQGWRVLWQRWKLGMGSLRVGQLSGAGTSSPWREEEAEPPGTDQPEAPLLQSGACKFQGAQIAA